MIRLPGQVVSVRESWSRFDSLYWSFITATTVGYDDICPLRKLSKTLPYWDIDAWICALLSLTLIRMLPVAISLVGSKLNLPTVLFVGWFGPRGIASVLYLLLVAHELGIDGHERILAVIALTVLLSVFAHGVSAVPLSHRYGNSSGKVSRT